MKNKTIVAAVAVLSTEFPNVTYEKLVAVVYGQEPIKKDKNEYMSVKNYAELMGVSSDTVKRMCKDGRIEFRRIGRQIRVIVGSERSICCGRGCEELISPEHQYCEEHRKYKKGQ